MANSTLAQLRRGEQAILETLELPEELSQRLMELGFFPGTIITGAGCAPGGDPRIFNVDGSEIALRKETASHLLTRPVPVPQSSGVQEPS